MGKNKPTIRQRYTSFKNMLPRIWRYLRNLFLGEIVLVVLGFISFGFIAGFDYAAEFVMSNIDPILIASGILPFLILISVIHYHSAERYVSTKKTRWVILFGVLSILFVISIMWNIKPWFISQYFPTPIPSSTRIPTTIPMMIMETATYIPIQTMTETPTNTPIPTVTPTNTFTPTPTPWLNDSFSSDNIDKRRWGEVTCSYPYFQHIVGAPVIDLDGEEFIDCYLPALLDEYEVDKIVVELKLLSGYSSAGFASLNTSCGDASLHFQFDRQIIRYRLEGRGWEGFVPHGLDMPVGITLVIEWLSDKNISLSAYETKNMELIRSEKLECSSAPQYVKIGAGTDSGYPMKIQIESVSLSGPKKD